MQVIAKSDNDTDVDQSAWVTHGVRDASLTMSVEKGAGRVGAKTSNCI